LTETQYDRSRSRERRRRTRRRLFLTAAAVAAAFLIVAAAGPWFGHLGLPWPGGAVAPGGQTVAGVSVSGADDAWHSAPVELRFKTPAGDPATAAWRVDGAAWRESRKARVAAPLDHGNDGEHVVEVRALGGGPVITYHVRIDTTPPEITAVSLSPDRISAAETLKLGFDVPTDPAGVRVDWAVVDTLGRRWASAARRTPPPAPRRWTGQRAPPRVARSSPARTACR